VNFNLVRDCKRPEADPSKLGATHWAQADFDEMASPAASSRVTMDALEVGHERLLECLLAPRLPTDFGGSV